MLSRFIDEPGLSDVATRLMFLALKRNITVTRVQFLIHLFNGVYQLTDHMMIKWWDDYEWRIGKVQEGIGHGLLLLLLKNTRKIT
jgi:hypothetical protein